MSTYADVSVLLQLCSSEISILLDMADRSLIAYMGDVLGKEKPTIKNMSGKSCPDWWDLRLSKERLSQSGLSEPVISLVIIPDPSCNTLNTWQSPPCVILPRRGTLFAQKPQANAWEGRSLQVPTCTRWLLSSLCFFFCIISVLSH